MKAVLTGATGFIGGAVARRLADEGVAVHALTRPGADRTRLAGRPIVFHDGRLYISYYASQSGKPAIYVAVVDLKT
ncbi:MAG: NAD-dependent epimerase/dehydratase family protein [Candidatus Promineofilum sp.]|nr:NAD-dependent epimerase/dehydratase family protein [Promineifilum sp.]